MESKMVIIYMIGALIIGIVIGRLSKVHANSFSRELRDLKHVNSELGERINRIRELVSNDND
jgi:uncharacterized membrane-anchored protein YhcB (DUF1043 family)